MNSTSPNDACLDRELALQALLLGELQGEERFDLEAHLLSCDGCSLALEMARDGIVALGSLREAPLPYQRTDETASERSRSEKHSLLRQAMAVAALLMIGVGFGRWGIPPEARRITLELTPEQVTAGLGVTGEAVEALARAQILVDLAVPYMEEMEGVLAAVLGLQAGSVSTEVVVTARERARDLLRDGRTLRRLLDPELDGALLSAVARADLFLEEVAALDPGGDGGSILMAQEAARSSRLNDRLASVDVSDSVSAAMEASGWIGEDEAIGTGDGP